MHRPQLVGVLPLAGRRLHRDFSSARNDDRGQNTVSWQTYLLIEPADYVKMQFRPSSESYDSKARMIHYSHSLLCLVPQQIKA